MRPGLRLLSDELIVRILDEARTILCSLGVEIHNPGVLELLIAHGARTKHQDTKAPIGSQKAKVKGQKDTVQGFRVRFTPDLIDRALKSVPSSFGLYDVLGNATHDFSGRKVHFTPGSAALNILDYRTETMRRPDTNDYVRYAMLVSRLPHLAAQSTAMIPGDVHERISDSYRLFLSLLYCEKPVVTGTFTVESFGVMKDMQVAVRGSEAALQEKPLAIFSCCPTSPLKWSAATAQCVVDCARSSIPVEFISMPLAGLVAPVTLVGTLVAHTAETLSGIVISQLAHPGTPVLYGGSPAIFDVRYETTPMGAIETMMSDCAYNEIGKYLGIPTQAYIGLSDAKLLDAQAGLESGLGAILAALAGINSVSGPGMLDFESCQSLEKLVLDNEICGMALRLIRGIEPQGDFPALPLFEELVREKHLLIADHTRRYLKSEHYFPGRVIDRATRSRRQEEGSLSLGERAHQEVERLVRAYQPSRLSDDVKRELVRRMEQEARRYGMADLPARP
jgi:trimethylamine--corrinoid protein Co-methyltransferase